MASSSTRTAGFADAGSGSPVVARQQADEPS
jgi:hypothetical protein